MFFAAPLSSSLRPPTIDCAWNNPNLVVGRITKSDTAVVDQKPPSGQQPRWMQAVHTEMFSEAELQCKPAPGTLALPGRLVVAAEGSEPNVVLSQVSGCPRNHQRAIQGQFGEAKDQEMGQLQAAKLRWR